MSYSSTRHKLESPKRGGASAEEMPPPDWSVGKSVDSFFISDWGGKAQLTVGSTSPGKVVLGYQKAKWTSHGEQASKQSSSLAFVNVLGSLPAMSSCPDSLHGRL